MKDTKVAARYAKSLLDLSIELKSLEVVLADMKMIYSVCAANSELTAVLRSPIIKSDKKLNILNEIFGKQICPLTQKFITLLSSKSRESYIMDIAEQFVNQYKTNKGITTAVISSASALDEASRNKVMDLVKKASKSEVELEEKVKADLIGGFVLRIGDTQIDASVLRQIKNLKRNFSENPYVKEF
jgi:F-type H+-transporting ATPase subunit delta